MWLTGHDEIWLKWITKKFHRNNCNKHDMSQMTCQMLLKVIFWCSVLQEDFECCTHTLVPRIETRSQKSFMIKLRKNISCSFSNLNMQCFFLALSLKRLCQKLSDGHKNNLKKWEVPIIGVIQHAMIIMCYQWHWKLILQLKWDVPHAMHNSNGCWSWHNYGI